MVVDGKRVPSSIISTHNSLRVGYQTDLTAHAIINGNPVNRRMVSGNFEPQARGEAVEESTTYSTFSSHERIECQNHHHLFQFRHIRKIFTEAVKFKVGILPNFGWRIGVNEVLVSWSFATFIGASSQGYCVKFVAFEQW